MKSGTRRPLERPREGLLLWTYLSDEEKRILAMLAIAETGDLKVISDEGWIQEIAEEFANEGIRTIKREIWEGSGDPLWKLVDMIRSEQGNCESTLYEYTLVEPNYRSTFPPLGLLRISVFLNLLASRPLFVRGLDRSMQLKAWDKIFISSLFTFELQGL